MPWIKRSGSAPKYRTPKHRQERERWVRVLERDGTVQCAQPVCVMPTRAIHNGQTWHLGHADNGVDYIGPVHPLCNVKDGARRGRAKQDAGPARPRRWSL